jgi:dinuclear metal center YbgI/SA1388 family protein
MRKLKNIYDFIDSFAPFATAEEYDNVGILIGNETDNINKILISLDITGDVIKEASENNIELILSHHPVIFNPVKRINRNDAVYKLIGKGIDALCCHTNLDKSDVCGTNIELGKMLGLRNIKRENDHIFTGVLDSNTDCSKFTEIIREKFNDVIWTADKGNIKKVGFCSGAGGSFVNEAAELCDAYITGEAHHHELIFAEERNFPMYVAGHYETEKPFVYTIRDKLSMEFPDLEISISEKETNPAIGRRY